MSTVQHVWEKLCSKDRQLERTEKKFIIQNTRRVLYLWVCIGRNRESATSARVERRALHAHWIARSREANDSQNKCFRFRKTSNLGLSHWWKKNIVMVFFNDKNLLWKEKGSTGDYVNKVRLQHENFSFFGANLEPLPFSLDVYQLILRLCL